MAKIVIRTLSLIFISFQLGCQLAPTRYSEHSEGQWQAKVLVKDHAKSESFIVNMDAYAVRDQFLRMDITAALGTPVASLVLQGEQISYILPQQKRYFEGPSSGRALSPILAVPVDPQIFYSLLFDVPPKQKGWTCAKDQKGFLKKCEQSKTGITVTWKERKGRRKNIFIDHKKASLQMNVSWFKPSLDAKKGLFVLKAPSRFKKYRLKK